MPTLFQRPESSLDLHTDAALLDPYPLYRELRDLGPAVWMSRYEAFALTRFQDVYDALGDPDLYSSARGTTFNDEMNKILEGITLCSDAPEHDVLRRVIMKPLRPNRIRELTDSIVTEADALVDRLVSQGSFDAATELAQYLPLSIVSNLVGLPEEGRERMLDWAAANFNCFGPINDRTLEAFPVVNEMVTYAATQCVPENLKPGSWGAMIHEAADRGEIAKEQCPLLMLDYLGPSLDTTIFAISNAILLFAQNPDQWDAVREDPAVIPNAINEVIRLESPIQAFSRCTTRDHALEGTTMPAGSRVMVFYGSANRDERKWDDPERFDVHREGLNDHVGFGHGPHQCVGQGIARLEIRSLLTALAKRVERFELGAVEQNINNVLRGQAKVEVTVH